MADHGSEVKKNGCFKSSNHDHEKSKIKKSGSFKVADHGSLTACDDTSVANRHIGEANKASKHAKRSQAVHVARCEQAFDVVQIVAVGVVGAHVQKQEQERYQEHRSNDNTTTTTTTTTTSTAASVLESEKGILPGDCESLTSIAYGSKSRRPRIWCPWSRYQRR